MEAADLNQTLADRVIPVAELSRLVDVDSGARVPVSVRAEPLICDSISKGDLLAVCTSTELRGCVKVEVAVLGSPSLIVLMVSVDVKQH